VRCRAVRQEAVHDLVDRAVAADGHHEVHALGGGLRAELAAVATVAGLDDVQLQLAGEGADQDVAHLRAGGRRRRVDDHERAHAARLTRVRADPRKEGPGGTAGQRAGPRNLAVVNEPTGGPPQPPRRGLDRLFGAAAETSTPRPRRARVAAPPALRWAAIVVAIEAAAVAVGALAWLWLTVTSTPDSLARALAEVVILALVAAGLAAAALGLSRVASWARGPVIAAQIFFGLSGFVAAFEAGRPLIGVPVLLVVAVELYLLATPEARLAYLDR
jgi:hypothetical protein